MRWHFDPVLAYTHRSSGMRLFAARRGLWVRRDRVDYVNSARGEIS